MKTLIFYSILFCFAAMGQAQVVTQLDEARISINPLAVKISSNVNDEVLSISEEYPGEFWANPIGFMEDKFDINDFISSLDVKDVDSYLVTFKTNKGYLEADFSKDGDLTSTNQQFKDILLPLELRQRLYENNQGWTMIKNSYSAKGTGDRVDKEIYRVKLQYGNKTRRVKMVPSIVGSSKVASN